MAQPVCPKCSSDFVKRVNRVGFEHLMSVFTFIRSGANRAGIDSETCNGASHTRESS
jgi:hypothetical protein